MSNNIKNKKKNYKEVEELLSFYYEEVTLSQVFRVTNVEF